MKNLSIGDAVKVTLILREDWMSPMSFSGGIVTKISGDNVHVFAEYNKCERHTFNWFGCGCYNVNAYLIEKI